MSGSYYTLNSKYNQLRSLLAGIPITGSGLTGDLNANNYDILNVDNITLNTINGLPPAGAENLEQTLTIGDDANGLNIQNLNQLGLQGGSTITDTTGDLVLQPPTNQTIQLGNNIYVDTQNNRVGINVPAPTEDLEIDGNIQMNTGGTSKIVFYDSPNAHEHGEIDAVGDGTNGGILKFQTKIDGGSVSEKLRIDNIGRIGLGGANYGTAGQVLTSNGASAPTWTAVSPTFPTQTYSCNVLTNGIVKGTGTGKFIVIGNFVQVQATISLSSVGATNGRVGLSLPTTIPFPATGNTTTLGSFKFIRFGTAWWVGSAFSVAAGEIAGLSYGTQDYMGIQNPTITLQIGDVVSMSVSYFY